MNKLLKIFIIFFCAPLCLAAQVTPMEGRALNYRIVGFSFPEKEQTASYKVQVASGNCNDEAAFQKNIIVTAVAKKNRVVAEVPAFGKPYTWRVVYLDKKQNATTGELHHFSTMASPDVNPDSVRMSITGNTGKYNDHYVFVDGNKVLYDMKGNPVWFFPGIDGLKPSAMHLRDLKRSPFGTITAIIDERIYEISYDGAVLWKGPGNGAVRTDSSNFDNSYHHEFTRMANGNYMTMAFEQGTWQLPAAVDSNTFAHFRGKIIDSNNIFYQRMLFGTIVEYDKQGNIAWRWSGSDYFKGSDLSKRMFRNKIFDLNDTHANAFYFDEKTQHIYISFRDISRVIKIQYPDSKVLATYGKLYAPGADSRLRNGLFCGQHGCRLSQEGYLYLFNNNICHSRALPTIVMFKEPKSDKDTLEKVWEFECPMEELGEHETTAGYFSFGGNVVEQPDRALLVCMGGLYGKVFIVNRDKQILWSGKPEKWDKTSGKWTKEGALVDAVAREGSYRASMIDRNELESIIWNEPLKK